MIAGTSGTVLILAQAPDDSLAPAATGSGASCYAKPTRTTIEMTETRDQKFDVVVIGAGPAGCAAATIIARGGRRVALVEREARPSYRVGESLIPFCWYPLNRLGLVDSVADSKFVVVKNSVQFASIDGRVSKPFYFFQHTDHPCARTWQVVRKEFDQLLLDNARDAGATYFPETSVKELLHADTGAVRGVHVIDRDGNEFDLAASVTIDASGRDTFSQTQLRWRERDKELRKHAIWTYYEGALRDEGVDEGTTTIAYLPDASWFWFIPLPNNQASVGLVGDKEYLFRDTRDSQKIFDREVLLQGWISKRLENARRVDDFRVTSDFSYRSRHCAADGLVLVGDAFSFLDPVFSSGVYFALYSGVIGADATLAALDANDTSAARFEEYGIKFREQMEPMRRLVYAFYDQGFNFGKFLKKYPDFRRDLTDCLIGDLDRDFTAFFEAVGESANIPDPLPHGGPLLS
ncbi:MAG: flavin-dependent dehydrogenase [Planctomycetota bacterium]